MEQKDRLSGTVFCAILTGVSLCCAVANAGTSYTWNPNGSGRWSESSRWTIGTALSDRVVINGCTATLTDDDVDWVNANIADIVFSNDGILELDISNDGASLTKPQFSGTGLVVKKGEGAFTIATPGANGTRNVLPNSGIRIEAGELAFTRAAGPIEVKAPGRLRPPADRNFDCYGLSGDGYVTNDVNKQFCFKSGTLDNPFVFSGRFLCKIDLTLSGGCQYLTNPEAAIGRSTNGQNGDVRLWNGTIGVSKLGRKGSSSSLGGVEDYWCRGNPTRILYLGEGGEITDHIFKFSGDSGPIIFDAGAIGGVTFSADIWTSHQNALKNTQLILDGSNTQECVISSDIREDDIHTTYLTKKGTGVWKLSARERGNHGAVAVQQGTLKYASLAEAGIGCALGYSDRLYTDHTGVKNAAQGTNTVPYALLLGDGEAYSMGDAISETAGTLEYCGTGPAAMCTTRPIALSGVGRLSNSGAPLTIAGVTSLGANTNALVLRADSDGNYVRCVTNGLGSVTVVKEGSGTWTVTGDMDFDGADVREGVLRLQTVDTCRYFRFAVKENYYGAKNNEGTVLTDSNVQLYGFQFCDENGECQSYDLVYRNCVGAAVPLHPGEVTDLRLFNTSGTCSINARGYRYVENLFTNLTIDVINRYDCIWSGNVMGKGRMVIENEETWPGFICRLPENAKPIAYYDIRAGAGFQKGTNEVREAKSWILEGSVDGVNWKTLHDVNTNANYVKTYRVWYSNNKETHSAANGYGYYIGDKTGVASRSFSAPIKVRVDGGSTLVSDGAVEVGGVVYDCAAGGGTLDGFAFVPNGRFDVVNLPAGAAEATLPMTFTNVTGLANVKSWSVQVGGARLPSKRVVATDAGFRIYPVGFLISFR